MLGGSAVITFALTLFLAVSSSVHIPTAAVVPLFSVVMPTVVLSVLVRTFASVFVQTTVPAFVHTFDYFLALVRAFFPRIGNPTMSLDLSANPPPMVPYSPDEGS